MDPSSTPLLPPTPSDPEQNHHDYGTTSNPLKPPAPPRVQRTVTFSQPPPAPSLNATSALRSSTAASTPGLAPQTLSSRLRRRNSAGAPPLPSPIGPLPKLGPQRTTKTAEKLKILPDPDPDPDGPDEESGRDVYSQFTRIKDPSARRDAARLGKADRERLPRVTAYCTCAGIQMEGAMRWLKSRGRLRGAQPKQFDECIYSPFSYGPDTRPDAMRSVTMHMVREPPGRSGYVERRYSDGALDVEEAVHGRPEAGPLIEYEDSQLQHEETNGTNPTGAPIPTRPAPPKPEQHDPDLDITVHTPEIFLFAYGVTVIWGMTAAHERRFLTDLAQFETEKLAAADVETEDFNFYYTRQYQARIYNDFISLKDRRNHMVKLAISHALAQSVKTSLFEALVDATIETTKDIPLVLSQTGTIPLPRLQLNKQIGQLFILRIQIHLQGSVLDSPELFWAEPQLEPIYGAVRKYLEMDQRVTLLTERLAVIGDLLMVLKEQVTQGHGERLEWIVIVLIAVEILVAAFNIVVDVWAGVD